MRVGPAVRSAGVIRDAGCGIPHPASRGAPKEQMHAQPASRIPSHPRTPYRPDNPHPGSSRMTIPRAIAVACLTAATAAAQGQLPTPESVLGHTVGADYKLANYTESIRYFERLDAASDRMQLVKVGQTSTGRDWTLAVISSPANLANLDRLRTIAQRLAHPSGLSDTEARALAREGKPFVDISGGLHASEVAGAQHTIQLAYDLVSKNDERTRAILDNTVILLWPSIN